jgi:uncharacterized protein
MMFLEDRPCLLIDDKLVLGDLHNGFEYAMYKKGVDIPSQTPQKLERIIAALTETKAKKLVILGDFKHNIPVTSRQEQKEVPEFIEALTPFVAEIIITKGNHDGGIEALLPSHVNIVNEFFENGVGFFHGHMKPSDEMLEAKKIIMGHSHPALLLKDIKPYFKPVWAETKIKDSATEVIVVPAFDENVRGIALNSEGPIGPLLKNFADLDNTDIFLLDGSYMGKLAELMLEKD